jgi:hypothetical protein
METVWCQHLDTEMEDGAQKMLLLPLYDDNDDDDDEMIPSKWRQGTKNRSLTKQQYTLQMRNAVNVVKSRVHLEGSFASAGS